MVSEALSWPVLRVVVAPGRGPKEIAAEILEALSAMQRQVTADRCPP